MSPVKVELCNKVFIVEKNKTEGFRLFNTNFGIACHGTENGGSVVFVCKRSNLESSHLYNNMGTVYIKKGDEPITKEIECRTNTGKKRTVITKITAI